MVRVPFGFTLVSFNDLLLSSHEAVMRRHCDIERRKQSLGSGGSFQECWKTLIGGKLYQVGTVLGISKRAAVEVAVVGRLAAEAKGLYV